MSVGFSRFIWDFPLLISTALSSDEMPQRRDKAEGSAPRKRALVSCDRCKLRRARCIRDNTDEPCADCRLSGVQCESKLPRKQRVYGSVETLSLRYRALESLVKGLFPQENTSDTTVIFALASARNIQMPAQDDFTPAEIFHDSGQRPLPTPFQEHVQSSVQPRQSQPSSLAIEQSIRSGSTSSLASSSRAGQHNPFLIEQPPARQVEEMIQTRHGVPHYFGPSSSFRLAMTIRTLSARCKAIHGGLYSPKQQETESNVSDPAIRPPPTLRTISTNPSDEEYTISDPQNPQPLDRGKQKALEQEETKENLQQSLDDASKPVTIADLLPSRSLADALVAAYFDHVHMFLPMFHRSIFQYKMEATYSRKSEVLGECKDTGWLICLALVFAFGCEQLHEHDPDQANTLRVRYLDVAKTYFRKLLTTTSLVNIQALLLLNLHYHTLGQKSTSWLLVGLAARMVSDNLL
jgi:proline utilization trans-activator